MSPYNCLVLMLSFYCYCYRDGSYYCEPCLTCSAWQRRRKHLPRIRVVVMASALNADVHDHRPRRHHYCMDDEDDSVNYSHYGCCAVAFFYLTCVFVRSFNNGRQIEKAYESLTLTIRSVGDVSSVSCLLPLA